MKKIYLIALISVFTILHAPTVKAAVGDFPWNYNGSNIYFNGGNVGIGTTNPADHLSINYSTPTDSFSSNVGKVYVGEGTGSWWILGNKGKDGRGYNNIATNAYVTNSWYRREFNKEAWIISNYVTENNTGYFKIFHSDPQNKSSIDNLKALLFIDSYGNTEINGKLRVKQITVTASGWADYVFEDGYKLQDLASLETFIKANKHLPNIPSAKEVINSNLDLAEISKLQMEKIEELTLHLIQKDKEIKSLQSEVAIIKASLGI